MTGAEKSLWSKIRGKQLNGLHFYRQKTIGDYIADFYCPKARLVIGIDGRQHYSYSVEGKEEDRLRAEYMARAGITVLRFSEREVLKNLEAVLEKIWTGL